jgi:hypothetical protein
MHRKTLAPGLAAMLLIVLGAIAVENSRAGDHAAQQRTGNTASCDRSCLIEFVDRYRSALLAHDATRLPLASDVRYTENTISLPLGNGTSESGRSIGGDRQELTSAHIPEAMGAVVVEVIGVSRSKHKNFRLDG